MSRYFDPADGPPHTRLSIYDGVGRVTCVIALDDDTTHSVGRFMLSLSGRSALPPPAREPLLDRLRSRLGAGGRPSSD